MATIGDLNVGDLVYNPYTYNDYNKQGASEGYKRATDCVKWQIIGKNHDASNTVTLMVVNSLDTFTQLYDFKEATNPDSNRVSAGNSRYKYSNILQWLNSSAVSNWYTAQHTYDAVYSSSNNCPGFLYRFGSDFKNILQSVSKTSVIPDVDGGGTETISKKVHLPSLTEIVNEKLDGNSEGTQYTYYSDLMANGKYFQIISGFRTPVYDSTSDIVLGYKGYGYIYYNGKKVDKSEYNASAVSNFCPIIVIPSSTKVSSVPYKYYSTSSSDTYYAVLDMPLIIELSGSNTKSTAPVGTITYKVYDENYNISSLQICLDSTSNVVYSTVNLEKGKDYTYSVDTTSWDIDESHTYYFVATNSNGTTATEKISIKKEDIRPDVLLYNETDSTWVDYYNIGSNVTKPPTVKAKVYDEDEVGQTMYVYLCSSSTLSPNYYISTLGTYTEDTEFTYTISDADWKALETNKNYYYYIVVSKTEFDGTTTVYNTNYAQFYFYKKTPAPYIETESVDIGEQNAGFTVSFTPKIDTIQTITNVSLYLDSTDTLLQSWNNPAADTELSYTVTKDALYDMDLGAHTLKIVISDDLSQTSETDIAFTRINNAPSVVAESSLGNQNLGFSFNFTGYDEEGDSFGVKAYIDDVSGSAFASIDTVTPNETQTIEVSKDILYSLSLGNHTIYLVATDSESQSTTTELTFTRTNNAPEITTNTELGNKNLAFDYSFSVNDTENDATSVNVYLDSVTGTPIETVENAVLGQTYTFTISKETLYGLTLAEHTLYFVATDDQEQTSTVTATFTRVNDTPIITASQESTVHYKDFDVTYKVLDTESDNTDVTFKIGSTTLATINNVELGTDLTQTISIENYRYGTKTLVITATDSIGNSSSTSLVFTVSSKPVIYAEDLGNYTESFTGTFQVADADGDAINVTATIDGSTQILDLENAPHDTDIELSVEDNVFSGLAYGEHTITISATDIQSNTVTKDITFTKNSIPTVVIENPTIGEITEPFSVNVTVNSADGDEVTIKAYIDGVEI